MIVSSSLKDYPVLVLLKDFEELFLEPVISFPVIRCDPVVGGCLVYVAQQNELVAFSCLFELFLKPFQLGFLLVCLFFPELRVIEKSVQGED